MTEFLFQGYLQPWKSEPDCSLSDHLTDLFNNLEEIYEFNRYFECALDEM